MSEIDDIVGNTGEINHSESGYRDLFKHLVGGKKGRESKPVCNTCMDLGHVDYPFTKCPDCGEKE